jgi:uncharacterized protein (DUF58 family)
LLLVVVPPLWPVLVAGLGVLATLVLLDAVALRRLQPVQLQRDLPARAFVGRDAEIVLRLRYPKSNAGPLVVDVFDEVPADLRGESPVFAGVVLRPGEETALTYAVRPEARGDRPLGRAIVLVRSPLQFLQRRVLCPNQDSVRVYPDASRFLHAQALQPERVLEVIGVKRARRRGQGMEFESLREYVQGDDIRRIDWAASARRGRPVVRSYQHERNHTVILAVDASRLMGAQFGGRSKLDYAIDATLALAYAALGLGDRVGVLVFDRDLRGYVAPRSYRRDLGLFLDLLRPVQPRLVEADYGACLRSLATRQRQRALVVMLTDFVEADASFFVAPLVLMGRRHRVLLVAIRDEIFAALAPLGMPAQEPERQFYRRLVLDDLLHERETALARLRRQGLHTLDLSPDQITPATLNRYLTLRYGLDR